MHSAQLTFPQRPAITAAACPRQLAMVYDQSPTDLAFALLPVFATLWSEQVSADGTEMLPAAAMEELMARVVAAVIITKDQLLNLAAELLPPGRMRELLRYLSQQVGYEEWQQIKHRRRRHLIDISISYLSRARLGQGDGLERVEKLPQRGYNSGEKEELLPKYVQMRRSNSSQVRFCRVFSAEHWQDLLQKLRYLPQHSYATPLLH